MNTRLNIWVSDVRRMLDTDGETELAKDLLEDKVLSIDEAIDCYNKECIEQWLKENAENYGYKVMEEN